jgi:YD repeat-containing protein
MRSLLTCAVLLVASSSFADAFPPDGVTTLVTDTGKKMSWTVKRDDGVVLINATHPNWSFEHRAQPDGTPLVTVKKRDGKTTRVTYTATGADLERTDAKGDVSKVTIKHPGLWDTDSLDARLGAMTWSKGKKVRFTIIDIDAGDGATYPMVVEYVAETTCGAVKCHHLRLAVDDLRRMFAPTFEYFYAVEGGKYLRHEGDGFVFNSSK